MNKTFWIGALGYPALEMCYRGRTHPAMALAGGLGLTGLRALHGVTARQPLWKAALLGGAGVTAMEYGIGRLCNRRYQIWDYRKAPLNVQGQICLPFTALWCALSAGVLLAYRHGPG